MTYQTNSSWGCSISLVAGWLLSNVGDYRLPHISHRTTDSPATFYSVVPANEEVLTNMLNRFR